MIEELVKIHDKFSVELKVGFTAAEQSEVNDFSVNMWVFIPNSLDINKYTYSKLDFYRDAKSNVRLITPIYLLRDISNESELPLRLLIRSFKQLATNPATANIADYETHIKMFQSIMKSSLRNEINHIISCKSEKDREFLVTSYIHNISEIAKHTVN